MTLKDTLLKRSGSQCELCTSLNDLQIYTLPPADVADTDNSILVCSTCLDQITNPENVKPNHWRCLNDSMWSDVTAVQVMIWRMLTRLRKEGWPVELLDMMYLDEHTLKWAESDLGIRSVSENNDHALTHLDSNGAKLEAGDTVILIKDLTVKGANFIAKRGTSVRNISLVWDNPQHIEGRVEGQQIVILTKFVKKQN